ncbi:hypothetical protein CALCODRAFT_232024 [Calocera cornea HHB12733]|uniref:Uncharacterized protein n=1 Tax=Calocera cornea HHB12733 TaxID=1353952 RepID=A0A165H057_9BASI|nr:hypothetical protein CALCODRAFT_232024 [Calocera cornea HHB12733]
MCAGCCWLAWPNERENQQFSAVRSGSSASRTRLSHLYVMKDCSPSTIVRSSNGQILDWTRHDMFSCGSRIAYPYLGRHYKGSGKEHLRRVNVCAWRRNLMGPYLPLRARQCDRRSNRAASYQNCLATLRLRHHFHSLSYLPSWMNRSKVEGTIGSFHSAKLVSGGMRRRTMGPT